MEIEMVKKAMTFHDNKISKAAASLGITRNSLYRRLEKYQIPFNDTEN
jgi:transcriptional regulator with PAS, ATPase and Fis domain